ncbi:hypothetical protein C2G38_2042909 [Gigaspora rosea]|uniref:Restriction of telomere capping protein 4 C-terminal domain-containing protein n=1 Tax=Gigaspora rosea TaxID=44941 RepID=A0A397UUE8_9GLOM|nr:hypothetical protein C2G38_2042909 [Gigaspora rosea]
MAKSFYISFDKILQEEIKAYVSGKKSISLTKNQIKNPPIIISKEVDDIEENIDFKSDNFQSSFKDCSIKENIQTRSTPTSENRLTFCKIHQAETTIVPNGIQKGSRKASTPMALMARFEVLRVLVPETALRLISQDRDSLELELAQEIMEDSADFGDYMYSE